MIKNSEIASRLRTIREYVGLTQVEVSAETGIPQSSLSAYELDSKNAPASAVALLAQCYCCSADLILGMVDSGIVRNNGEIHF